MIPISQYHTAHKEVWGRISRIRLNHTEKPIFEKYRIAHEVEQDMGWPEETVKAECPACSYVLNEFIEDEQDCTNCPIERPCDSCLVLESLLYKWQHLFYMEKNWEEAAKVAILIRDMTWKYTREVQSPV